MKVSTIANACSYWFASPTSTRKNRSFKLSIGFLVLMMLSSVMGSAQVLWSSAGGSAWLTGSNWTGAAVPTSSQIAQFGANPTAATGVGINYSNATNNGTRNQIVGAIEVSSARAAAFLVGNSSGTAGNTGILTLAGVTVNSVSNVVLRNNSSQSFTIQNTQGTGVSTLEVALANTTDNIVNIDGTGGITISSIISGSSKKLTKGGTGAGILQLTGANTYTGLTTVNGGTLQLNRSGGTTIPATNDVTVTAGTLRISSNQTLNNLTVASGATLTVDAGVTLTINGTYSVSQTANIGTGSVLINGTLRIEQGGFPGTTGTWTYGASGTLVYNNTSGPYGPVDATHVYWPSTSGPVNVTIQNGGGVNLSVARTVSGTTTIASGTTFQVTGVTYTANGAVAANGSFQINQGGFASGSGTWTYGASGTLIYNNSSGSFGENGGSYWPTTNGPVNVNVAGAGGLTMNVARTISGTLQTAAGVTNGSNLTLNGTCQINAGGFFSASSPTYGSSSTLVYSTAQTSGSPYVTSLEWPSTNGPVNVTTQNSTFIALSADRTVTGNFTITSGGVRSNSGLKTITMSGGTSGSPKTFSNSGSMFGEFSGHTLGLTFSGFTQIAGSTGYLDAKTFTITGTLICGTQGLNSNSASPAAGQVIIASGGTLRTSNTNGLYDGATANPTIRFNGTAMAAPSIDANSFVEYNATTGGQTVSALTYGNLLFTNTSGNNTLAGNVTAGQVDIGASTVTTSSNTLIVTSSATNAVSRTTGYVIGRLQRGIASGANTYSFAVGTASGYTPFTMAFNGGTTSSSGTILGYALNGASSNYPSQLSATKYVARYWTVTASGLSGYSATGTFNYLSGDLVGGATQSSVKAYKFDAPSTYSFPTSSTGTLSFTASGITSFSEFGAGECTPPTLTTTSITSACDAASVDLNSGITSSTSGLTVTFYSDAGLTNVISNTVTASATYYVKVDNGVCTNSASIAVTMLTSTHNSSTVTACDSYFWVTDGNTYTSSGDYTYNYTNGAGCASTDTLHLTINNSTHNSSTVTACDSYTWTGGTGSTYTTSGDYLYNYTNGAGCASTDTLHLTINNSTHNSSTVTACYTYTWTSGDGNTYTSSGTYLYNYTNGAGCASTDTLHLTIATGTFNSTTVTACDSYTWTSGDGNTYTTGGTYIYNYNNGAGCASADTLHLTVNGSTHNSSTVTACDSYTWTAGTGSTYTSSGTYLYNYTNGAGCASVDTLHLTINNSTHNSSTVTACDSYTWTAGTGSTYTSSGDYTYNYTNGAGCASTDTLHLTIATGTYNSTTVTACDSYTWTSGDGNTYTTGGTYIYNYNNGAGCASADTLHLTINNSTHNSTTATACDSYTWTAGTGSTYTSSGTYLYNYTNGAGCASVDTLHLTINNSTHNSSTVTACDTYTWTSGDGNTYTSSGTYLYNYTNGAGCASTDTLHLTIATGTYNSTTVTACDSYTWTSGDGNTYTTSGNYIYNYNNGAGCASADTLHLTINNSTHNSTTATACESYTWTGGTGSTYTTSGTYLYNYTNGAGCASVDTLHLTINYGTHNSSTVTACYTYTWTSGDGNTYTSSGTYTYSYTNGAGCASVDTLHLTIATGTFNSTTVTACDSYTWTSGNGNTYTATGDYIYNYTNGSGCASADTLHLTINNSTHNSTTATACESYTWTTDGNTYTTSGTYLYNYTNGAGCASVDTLHLTINYGTHNSSTVTACDSYTWATDGNTYTTGGTYTYSYTNGAGCASVDTLHLTVNSSTHNSSTVTACDSYTWTGGTGSTYTTSGDYLYNYTNGAGCASTDTLHLTINNSTHNSTTASACTSYTWATDGNTYTSSGTYLYNYTNGAGCASTDTLHLTILTYTITASAGTGGSISPNGATTVNCSANQTFTITANSCFRILDVVVDGSSVGAVSTYTFTNVTANHTISATFDNTFTVTSSAGSNGTVALATPPATTLTENFNYTSGTNLTANGWTAATSGAGTNPITITSSGLTYPGSTVSGIGKAVSMTTSGEDDSKTFTAVTSGSLYASLLVNVSAAQATGDYFFAFTTGSATSPGFVTRVHVKSTTGGFYFGIGKTTGTVTYETGAARTFGTTYQLVVKNVFNTGTTTDDVVHLWINPALGGTEPSSTLSTSNGNDAAAGGIVGVTLRQGTAANAATQQVDGIMVGTSWAAVTPAVSPVGCGDNLTYNITPNSCFKIADVLVDGASVGTPSTYTFSNISANHTISATFAALSPGTVSGTTPLCIGGTTTYTTTGDAGGAWSSTNTAVATVNSSTGAVSAVGAGTTNIRYTFACNGSFAEQALTVQPNASVASVTGTSPLCIGATPTYSANSVVLSGGTGAWSSGNSAIASVDGSGVVTAVSAGTTSITYTITGGCGGTASASQNVTVSPNANAGTVSGTSPLCMGASATFTSDGDAGGTWSSNNTSVATVNASSGLVTAVGQGSATITYTVNSGCNNPVSSNTSVSVVGVDWANLQWPPSGTVCQNSNFDIYGQVYEPGITEAAGQGSGIDVQFGYGTSSDPTTWSNWSNATFNTQSGNNDEYKGTLNIATPGTYFYTFRYKLSSCSSWQYGGYSSGGGGFWDGSTYVSGQLTVNAETHNSTSVTACDSYTWTAGTGSTYTSSGTYTYSYTNGSGCASVDTLHLTINNSTHNSTTAAACDSYTWTSGDGNTYTASGTYTYNYTNGSGCASTDTLHLTINNSTHNSTTATACDSYTWTSGDGNTYTASGTYLYNYTNGSGCASTDTLHLTINSSTHNSTTATACDSYTWTSGDGNTYTASGTYTYNYTNGSGCASTDTLHLTINNSTHNSTTATACDSYTWTSGDGNTYTTSGTYTYNYTNGAGCASADTLHLTINSSTHNSTTATACDSYTWTSGDGNTYTASGTYTYNYTNGAGCPSTDTLHLTINNSTHNSTTATACDSYTWSTDGNTYTSSGTYTYNYTNGAGCASTDTLHLTINNSTHNSTTITACDSYTWATDGNTYTSSGTYTYNYTNGSGCASTDTLHLTINSSTHNSTTASACDSYTWTSGNGNTYTTSGTYLYNYTNGSGCASTDTLHLTINYGTFNSTTVSACNTYTWTSGDGNTYTSSGTYLYNYTNGSGCASTDTLHLTINTGTFNATTVTACDSYTWTSGDGNTYTASGTYVYNYNNGFGCASADTLHLTINNSTHNSTTATACDSYTWATDGNTYTSSGTYTYNYTNGSGCASTDTLHLTINNSTHNSTTVTACNSYTWATDGNTYTSSGTYTYNYTNGSGCASTDTLHLTVNYSTYNSTTVTACDSYTWTSGDGNTYTSSGTYLYNYTNGSGCASTDTLHLTINNSTHNSTTATACESYTWATDGNTYTTSGTYLYNYTNGSGCASTDTLHLTINYGTHNSSTVTACDSYTWATDGNTYTTSGTYTYNYTNGFGCASVDTLHLTVNYSTHNSTTVTACDSYTWTAGTGSTYTTSGTYLYNYTNGSGCASTDTLHLTINNSTHNSTTATACESYTWATDGNTYTTSGTYLYNYTNGSGCASTDTLHLTVNYGTHNSSTITACDSYTWATDGNTYTTSGTYTYNYTNGFGCASTDTLHLTVNYSTHNSTTVTVCDSYTWTAGTGSTYTTSGTYLYNYTNGSGCASTDTLHLTVNYSTHNSSTVTACDSYTWTAGTGSTYTTSGTYLYNYTNGSGCASTDTLHLTVNYSPTASAGGSQTICQNGTATVSGATATNGSILWTHNGAGSLSNATTLTPTYTAAAGDAGNTVTLTLTVTNAPCTPATATYTVVVNALPTASAGGSQTICQNGSATVSGASAANGSILWSHNGAGSLTNATSLTPTYTAAAGDAGNTVTLTLTVSSTNACSPATATATYSVVVNPLPTASAGGTQTICSNGSATVSGASSSNGTRLWTHNGTGSITNATSLTPTYTAAAGDAGNTVTLTMTVTSNNACAPQTATATYTVVVSPNANAGTVSGTTPLCIGATTTYTSNGDAGGTWSSTNTAVATVNSTTGFVTAVAAGTTNITYTVNTGCLSPVSAFKTLTVSPNNNAGTITGPSSVCVGSTISLGSTGDAGGTWTSSNPARATVNPSTGAVTGVSAGTTIITYSVGCNATATKGIVVVAQPVAGTVNGTTPLCIGQTATYTNSGGTTGGTWSSTNTSVATVNSSSGLVTAVGAGTTDITYTVTTGAACTPVSSFKTLTVNPNANAGTVTGSSPLCIGATATYSSNGDAGGTWSSSNTGVATVNPSTGLVTAVAAGTCNIVYTVNTGCNSPVSASASLTVNANANAGTISGTTPLCIGQTNTYTSNGDAGGTWSSSNTGVVTVNPTSGLVTGIAAGTATITYTVTGCNGPSVSNKSVTVNPNANAGTVTGSSPLCIGSTTTYSSDGDAGGIWSSSNTGIATVNASTGLVTAVGAGTCNIVYTVNSGCNTPVSSSASLTVSPNANAGTVSGTSPLCIGATATYSSNGDAGGTWSSSNTGVATVNPSTGLVTAVAAGTCNIVYTVSSGCNAPASSSASLTVNPNVNAGTVSGTSPICVFSTTTFTSTGDAGGTWSSDNTGVATVNPTTGLVSGVGAGTATITYTVTGCNGPATASQTISVGAGTVTGDTTATACNSFTWYGTTYTASGTPTHTFPSAGGCDSVVTLHLTINYSSTGDTTVTACNLFTWYGTTYFASGTPTHVVGPNAAGCDSVVTLHLTIITPPATPGAISGPIDACPYMGTTDTLTYSIAAVSGATSYTWSVPGTGVTIISGQGTTTLKVQYTNSFSGGTISVFATGTCGNSASSSTLMIGRNLPATPAAISGPTNVCSYMGQPDTATYSIAAVTYATSYTWTAPANATIVSGQGTTSVRVIFTTSFVSGQILVKANANCGSSSNRSLNLTKTLPGVPGVISGPANVCPYIGAGPVTYSITPVAGALTHRWTLPTNATIVSINAADSSSVNITFSGLPSPLSLKVRSVSGCGTSGDRSLTLSTTAPATPGGITGPTNVCSYMGTGNNATFWIRKVTNATSYVWTMPAGATIVGPTNDTLITVSFTTSFVASSITVQAQSPCGISAVRSKALSVTLPTIPGAITGPTDACPYMGTGDTVVYTIRKVSTALSYQWTLAAGMNFVPGYPTNDTIIRVTFDNSFGNSFITVKSVSGCGNSSARALTINKRLPITPGAIAGPTDVCPLVVMHTGDDTTGKTAVYAIRKVNYATSYSWTVPAGATITGHPSGTGATDTLITVLFDSSFTTGAITVKANANCGSSGTRSLTLMRRLPLVPGTITATVISTCPSRQVSYQVASMPTYATSIQWTVPFGGVIDSGQGTTKIYVSYAVSAVSGQVKAVAYNNCANSAARALSVTMAPCPPVIARETGNGNILVKPSVQPADVTELEVKVMPNPSQNQFVMIVQSSDTKTPINVQIADIGGRMIEAKQGIVNGQTIVVGGTYRQGVYIAEFIQGEKKKILKLIKL